jgi:hypothetical protein
MMRGDYILHLTLMHFIYKLMLLLMWKECNEGVKCKEMHQEIFANVKLTFLKSFFWIGTNLISKHSMATKCRPAIIVHITIGVNILLHQLAKISASTKTRILYSSLRDFDP